MASGNTPREPATVMQKPTDAERKARAERYAEKARSPEWTGPRVLNPPTDTEPKSPKTGQTYESPGGMGFTIESMDRKSVTVKVDRVVRKRDDKKTVEVRTRIVDRKDFENFARPYTLVS